jgi:hypothetical protein
MHVRLFVCGLGIWAVGTVALRLAGQNLLRPGDTLRILILFAVSFPVMAWVSRRLCARFQLLPQDWPAGAISIVLPTLLLDPFSSAFFPSVFRTFRPKRRVCSVDGCCVAARAHLPAQSPGPVSSGFPTPPCQPKNNRCMIRPGRNVSPPAMSRPPTYSPIIAIW